MKKIIFTLLIAVSFYSNATVKISVIDGDWFSPSTWSPASVPMGEDTVIINTTVHFDELVDVGIATLIIKNGHTLVGTDDFALHGNLFNYGTINVLKLAVGDGELTTNKGLIKGSHYATSNTLLENFGDIESDTLSVSNNTFINTGSINNLLIVLSEDFKNDGYITTIDFVTAGLLTNNRDISVSNFTAGDGTVTGVDGKFCIAECFTNAGTITGGLDFCDDSPGGICDINVGSIAGTITFCAVSDCFADAKIEENSETINFEVYPNPATTNITLTIAADKTTEYAVLIYSISGDILFEKENITTNKIQLDVSNFAAGTYFCVINGTNFTSRQMLIIQ